MTTDLAPLVSQWFEVLPAGIIIRNGSRPPVEAFDLLGYHLVKKGSEYRLQVGDFCAAYHSTYPDIYEAKAQQFFVKTQTVEAWASVCRRVPIYVRLDGLLYTHYRTVMAVDDWKTQYRYLQYCLDNNLNTREFELWVAEQQNTLPPPTYQDKQFERAVQEHKELNELTRVNSEFALRIAEQEAELDRLNGKSAIAPADLPGYATRALGDIENALVEFGYSSVTVYADGSVRWNK